MLVPSGPVHAAESYRNPEATALRSEGSLSRIGGAVSALASTGFGLSAAAEFHSHEYPAGTVLTAAALMTALASAELINKSYQREAEARGEQY
jgi:hypothetical protein